MFETGGSNYGAAQRAGQVTFGTVVLKRGLTGNRDLWNAFASVTERGRSATRFDITITVLGPGGPPAIGPFTPPDGGRQRDTGHGFRCQLSARRCGDLRRRCRVEGRCGRFAGVGETHL